MDKNGRGLTAWTGALFESKAFWSRKMGRALNQGIFKLCPRRIRSLLRPLALLSFATVVPFFRAMAERVSPLTTVYFEPEDFLAVDFVGVDFFFAELLAATVFLGADEVLVGLVFVDPVKA